MSTEDKARSQRPFHFVERLYAPNTRNKIPKKELRKLLAKFREMDTDGNGRLSQEEFCAAHPGMDSSKRSSQYLFSLLDSDGTGDIDFQEMLIGLILSDSNRNDEDKLEAMVYMYAKESKDDEDKFKIMGKEAKELLRFLLKLAPKTVPRAELMILEGMYSSVVVSEDNEEEKKKEGEEERLFNRSLDDDGEPALPPALNISSSMPQKIPLPPKLKISATLATGTGISKRVERLTEKNIISMLDEKKSYSASSLYQILNKQYPGLFDELRSSFVNGGGDGFFDKLFDVGGDEGDMV